MVHEGILRGAGVVSLSTDYVWTVIDRVLAAYSPVAAPFVGVDR